MFSFSDQLHINDLEFPQFSKHSKRVSASEGLDLQLLEAGMEGWVLFLCI